MKKLKEEKQTKNKKKKKGIGKKILLLLLLLLLIVGGVFAYKVHKNGGGLKGILATAIGHDQETVKTLPKIYCLLLGQSENLTDTIMIAEYDPQKQQASMLSIPRDTFIGYNKSQATAWDKINAVYQTGDENSLKEVNELTGLDIKYYLKVDTQAFKALVDAIGGVTFDVPIDMKYDSNRQNLHINLKAGVQKLDGDKAEQVVRFRHNNDGSTYPSEYGIEDYGRMKTQRNFLKALAKQTLKVENILKINEFIDIAQKYVETNIDFNIVKDYIPYIVEFNTENLRTEQLPGASEYTNGVWIYAAEEQETAKVIDKLFLNPELQDEEIDTSSVDTTGIDKSKIKIEVLNGSGSSVKLEKIENRLKKAGYTNIQSSETSSIDNSIIIKRGNVENAAIDEMKLLVQTQRSSSAEETDVDVTIILGKDE